MDDLKSGLAVLHSWAESGDDLELDDAKRRQIECVKAQLKTLKDKPSPLFSLTWSYGKLLVAEIDHESVSSKTCQTILSTFVKSLTSSNLLKIVDDQQKLWKMLLLSDNVKGLIKQAVPDDQTCLYKTFLSNCFLNMRKSDICDIMVEFVMTSQAPCLLGLLKKQHQRNTLYQILDFLLVQLVHPFSDKAQDTAKNFLKSCGWKIADPIREVLNQALINEDDTMDHFASHQDVYKIIFELLLLNKDLVVGLLNNTELCLANYRQDRFVGIEFFCKLFGAKLIPGVPKPTELYSRLWHTFLAHCRNVSLLESSELLILAKYTPDILSRPDAHDAWCSLLFFFFQYILPKQCKIAFLTGITTAVSKDVLIILKPGTKTIPQLIRNFLNPFGEYALRGEAWKHLVQDLSDIYSNTANTVVKTMGWLTVHESSGWILSSLLSTCNTLAPSNEKWCMLRKLFVKKLVPSDMAPRDRMKMFVFLWINTDVEEWSLLHELFQMTKIARELIINILVRRDNTKPSADFLTNILCRLSPLVTQIYSEGYMFLTKKFFPILGTTPELRKLVRKLLCGKNSCEENFKMSARIKELFLTRVKDDMKIINGLLFYLCEITFDASAMKHLIELVDKCVGCETTSSATDENTLHIALTSLRLLSETLNMEPKLGIDNVNVLSCILKWSKSTNDRISMLALRCLTSFHPYCLGTEYVLEMVPVWFQIISCGSRGQVKMAIRCVACHSSTLRDENLAQVFEMISNSLKHPKGDEEFARGVSALGHFAAVSPLALKHHVEADCVSVLIMGVLKNILIPNKDSVRSDSSDNTWVGWQELPHSISLTVQALRSIGRCMRYCGTPKNVSMAVSAFKAILFRSGERLCHLREVERDCILTEAAAAVLHIFENTQFHSMVSKELLSLLSQVLTHPRVEVRHIFAEKLVQGLCIYKARSARIGRSRGGLPPCMLGLLALLGTDLWQGMTKSREMAEARLNEVFVSRYIAAEREVPLSLHHYFEKKPYLVLEIIFVAAVPIIAEHSLFQSWSFSDDFFKENLELILTVSNCFDFVRRMVCHPETFGGLVSKDYIQKMFVKAKQSLYVINNPNMAKIYSVVFELLGISLKMYEPRRDLTPSVHLPLPFYVEEHREQINQFPYLTEANVIEIQKYFRNASKKRKIVHEEEEDTPEDKVVQLDETDPCAQENNTSVLSLEHSEQSLSDEDSSPSASPPELILNHDSYSFGVPPVHSTPTGRLGQTPSFLFRN